MRVIALILYSLIAVLPLAAQPRGNGAVQCPVVRIEAERLADLNLPRYGHSLLLLNGEPTVIGGHTTNFVPTPTLEYYKDGKWHLLPTAFTHDDGCAVELTTGKVLIFGGHKENLGVGQSFEAELYDPLTRTSAGFASIYTRRAMASALALDDGRAVIVGNWYHADGIEMYDGKNSFFPVKGVSIARCTPYILRTSKDDAIIVGGTDSVGQQITLPVVDRLNGEPYHVPLLETWRIQLGCLLWPSSNVFIGDESKGDYSYLLPVKNDEGQIAIARVTNGEFSLLSTDVPIPMSCRWGEILYHNGSFLVDKPGRRAYLLGVDARAVANLSDITRVYIVAIDYATDPARVTLCYTDEMAELDILCPLMTTEGNIMLIGGLPSQSFFKPTAATWMLHVSPRAQAVKKGLPLWSWLLISLGLAALAAWLFMLMRRKNRNRQTVEAISSPVEEHVSEPDIPIEDARETLNSDEDSAELMHRLCQMMEEQRLFLNPDLKVTDVANMLGTNRMAISNCIKSQRICTFPQFVNTYRVALAQELLSSQPDIKMMEVCVAAGFSSESSFYRIFKSITGYTPNDWKRNNRSAR